MAVEGSRPWLDAAGHQFVVSVPPEPLWLEADPLRLTQVLLNLLNNAAKYTEPGGTISLSAAAAPNGPRGAEVVFRVRDTGIGIPPEIMPRIFEMFTQVDRTLERTQGGLGIGLALVRGLLHLHGGQIEVYSQGLGRGSEFVVRLPRPQMQLAPNGDSNATGHADDEAIPLAASSLSMTTRTRPRAWPCCCRRWVSRSPTWPTMAWQDWRRRPAYDRRWCCAMHWLAGNSTATR